MSFLGEALKTPDFWALSKRLKPPSSPCLCIRVSKKNRAHVNERVFEILVATIS